MDKNEAERFVKVCSDPNLAPVHLHDVIEDALFQRKRFTRFLAMDHRKAEKGPCESTAFLFWKDVLYFFGM